jgi:hypothetical protein
MFPPVIHLSEIEIHDKVDFCSSGDPLYTPPLVGQASRLSDKEDVFLLTPHKLILYEKLTIIVPIRFLLRDFQLFCGSIIRNRYAHQKD